MLVYPQLNPVALSLGPIKVHWYGLMYLLGFLFFLYGGKWRLKKYGHPFLTGELLEELLFYGVFGVILGGRLGYCLFYKPEYYLANPIEIIKVWHGGMAFHGGILGAIIALFLFSRRIKCNFFALCDFVAPLIPFGLMCGRIGNFINGELWGRVTSSNLAWAMVYPQSGNLLPRHPSEIYEALGEGLLLMIILWAYASKKRNIGAISGMFMLSYGIIRFFLEYFREPDEFLQNLVQVTGFSMGQMLCLPMILIGLIVYYLSYRRKL